MKQHQMRQNVENVGTGAEGAGKWKLGAEGAGECAAPCHDSIARSGRANTWVGADRRGPTVQRVPQHTVGANRSPQSARNKQTNTETDISRTIGEHLWACPARAGVGTPATVRVCFFKFHRAVRVWSAPVSVFRCRLQDLPACRALVRTSVVRAGRVRRLGRGGGSGRRRLLLLPPRLARAVVLDGDVRVGRERAAGAAPAAGVAAAPQTGQSLAAAEPPCLRGEPCDVGARALKVARRPRVEVLHRVQGF
eukprot:gene5747-biopygen17764